uniref:RRM domain-containing protein n=1 Tax=Cucumis melo TaxID=3656 RepID=A0A9I9E9S6_CUCME
PLLFHFAASCTIFLFSNFFILLRDWIFTVDNDSSIYVDGLPYDAMKDSFHRIFNLYNAIVVVKIINDRSTKGKCYGFVTFTNPQSTIDAIKDMDGRVC